MDVESFTDSSCTDDEPLSWISWFCEKPENMFFCQVDFDYIESSFNLYGLKDEVENFKRHRRTILEEINDSSSIDENVPAYWSKPEVADLYGRIHARYIVTAAGQRAMAQKYRTGEFGVCPKYLCDRQPVLPIGLSDHREQDSVKVFCPNCHGIFETEPGIESDGAYFGRTFPHFLLICRPDLLPRRTDPPRPDKIVPTVFGFRIHKSSPFYARRGGGVSEPAAAAATATRRGGGFRSLDAIDKALAEKKREATKEASSKHQIAEKTAM